MLDHFRRATRVGKIPKARRRPRDVFDRSPASPAVRARHAQRHEATAAIVTRHGRASRDCVNGVCVQGTVICLLLTRGRRRRRRWLARASMSMRCGLQTLLEAARFVELQEEFEKQQLVTLHAAGNDYTMHILF